MKTNLLRMLKLAMMAVLFLIGVNGWGQANPGDIAFIAVNTDGEDDFAFVALVDIPASAIIYFTDNEWNGTAFVDLNEGELTWTNGASILSAGSIVVFTDPKNTGTRTVNVGSVSGSGWDLNVSDEWIYALLSAPATSYGSTPVFLAALASDAGVNWISGTGLTEGTSAVDFNNDFDGFLYTGLRSGQSSFSSYLSSIYNTSKWTNQNSNGELILPISTTAFTITSGGSPTITLSTTSLTGFSYLEGSGPSSEQSFSIEGSNLTANISITPPTNYQISTGTGGSFVATNPINLIQSGGSVSATTINVRLKSGLSGGTYNSEDITASSTGATAKTVTCSGDVTPILSLPLTEEFSGAGFPTGWNYDDFTIAASANAGGSANEAALSNNNDVPNASHITTAPINTTGSTNLVLQWNQNVNFYESGVGTDFVVKVQTSTDGTIFTDIWSQTVTADETANKQTSVNVAQGAGSGTLYIRWLYFSNTTNRFSNWYIDDISLIESTAPNDPASFSASTPTTTQINLSATANGNGDDIIVAYNTTASFGTPADGNSYNVNDAIAGGGTVMYAGTAASLSSHTGLTPGTTYYYKAWSVDGSLLYSLGLSDDATTLTPEPSNHVTDFLVTTASTSHNSITITWSDNDGVYAAENFLIKASATSYAAISDPVDGAPEADAALVKNIASGVQNVEFTGLTASTTYYFKIWPYANSGSSIDYKTGSESHTTETTDATPPLPNAWINEIHYDNSVTDADEIVEVVVEGVSGYDLTKFQLHLVNGNDGAIYKSKTLNIFSAGSVTNDHSLYYFNYSTDGGIQNGAPDGIALEYDGTLIMFISYEGSFTGVGGIVDGVTSTDILVSESASAAGTSLQLLPSAKSSSKSSYVDFVWTVGNAATAGNENSNGSGDQVLPINLISFAAESGEGFVALNWRTSSEVNNSHFNIMRSADGNNFEEIGRVAGNGNSNVIQNYSFSDLFEIIDIAYYRLIQTDYDGAQSFSKIIAVQNANLTQVIHAIYLNQSQLNMEISSIENSNALVQIYSAEGQLLSNTNINLVAGKQNYQMDLPIISSGLYLVNLISNQGVITKKIFIP